MTWIVRCVIPNSAPNRRWRLQFRCRGSRHESAVAQLSTLGVIRVLRFWHEGTDPFEAVSRFESGAEADSGMSCCGAGGSYSPPPAKGRAFARHESAWQQWLIYFAPLRLSCEPVWFTIQSR